MSSAALAFDGMCVCVSRDTGRGRERNRESERQPQRQGRHAVPGGEKVRREPGSRLSAKRVSPSDSLRKAMQWNPFLGTHTPSKQTNTHTCTFPMILLIINKDCSCDDSSSSRNIFRINRAILAWHVSCSAGGEGKGVPKDVSRLPDSSLTLPRHSRSPQIVAETANTMNIRPPITVTLLAEII